MRRVFATLILAMLGGTSLAQPSGKRVAVVAATGATARSGPGDNFPDTGALAPQTRVVVVETLTDWVAIEPPPGQVAWLPWVHLYDPFAAPGTPGAPAPNGQPWDAIINPEGAAEVPVRAGRPDTPRPLPVQRLTLPRGTIVRVIGNLVEVDGQKWYPVEPPAGDRRYIPLSAVTFTAAAAPTFAVRSPANSGGVLPTAGETVTPAPLAIPTGPAADTPTDHPLWNQAETAFRDRDYPRASKLFERIGVEMNRADRQAAAAICFARVHEVRAAERTAPGSRPNPDPRPRDAEWYGPGQLRLVGFKYDGNTTYALTTHDGRTTHYIQAEAGVELDRFRDYSVVVYGSERTVPELRGVPLVRATRIQQPARR